MSAFSGESAIVQQQRGISPPERFKDLTTPDSHLDFESINELNRLREENSELKARLRSHSRAGEVTEDAPLGMTTFSPARDSHPQAAGDTSQMQSGLNELGRRLMNLLTKVGANMTMHNSNHDYSIALLKDFIYEIDEKV